MITLSPGKAARQDIPSALDPSAPDADAGGPGAAPPDLPPPVPATDSAGTWVQLPLPFPDPDDPDAGWGTVHGPRRHGWALPPVRKR